MVLTECCGGHMLIQNIAVGTIFSCCFVGLTYNYCRKDSISKEYECPTGVAAVDATDPSATNTSTASTTSSATEVYTPAPASVVEPVPVVVGICYDS